MLWLSLFRRYFFSSKSHSLIRVTARASLGGLAVSTAALILILAVMDGFARAVKFRLLQGEPHIVVRPGLPKKGSRSKENSPPPSLNAGLSNPSLPRQKKADPPSIAFPRQKKALLGLIESKELREGVQSLSFTESQDLLLKTPAGFAGAAAKGLEALDFLGKAHANESQAAKDRAAASPAIVQSKPLLILNEPLRAALAVQEGDWALVTPVAALLLPPLSAPPLKKARVWKIVESGVGSGAEEALSVFYEKGRLDFSALSNIRPAWEIRLKDPEKWRLYMPFFTDFQAESWAERNSSLLFALKMEKFIMVLFVSLAVLISCLGVSTALFMVTSQKAKDIGFLQAAGLSRRETVQTFAKTGLALAVTGAAAGLILGVFLIACIKYGRLNILPPMYYDRSPPVAFSFWQCALVFIGTLAVAWPACLIPASRLSRVPPAELLKSVPR